MTRIPCMEYSPSAWPRHTLRTGSSDILNHDAGIRKIFTPSGKGYQVVRRSCKPGVLTSPGLSCFMRRGWPSIIVGGSVPARTKLLLLLPLERTLVMSREADLLPGPPARAMQMIICLFKFRSLILKSINATCPADFLSQDGPGACQERPQVTIS